MVPLKVMTRKHKIKTVIEGKLNEWRLFSKPGTCI